MSGTQLRSEVRRAEDSLAEQLRTSNASSLELRTAVATVVARRVSVAQLPSGSAVTQPVPDSSVSVAIPSSILQAVGGDVIFSIAACGARAMQSFDGTETGAPLGTAPVSVRIRSAATLQDANFASSMPGQVVIELMPAAPAEARCGYWDTAQQRWSSQGLTRMTNANGTFACATTHLTIFAAILGEFEKTILCSNAHVFSDSGVRAIARGDWWYRAPAVILWVLLLSQVALLVWAAACDFRIFYKAIWRDDDLLTTNEAFQGRDEVGCIAWIVESITRYLPDGQEPQQPDEEAAEEPRRKQKGCCGRCKALIDSVTVTMTADCAHYQVAQGEKITPEDLRDIVLGAPSALEEEKQVKASKPPDFCTQCQTPYEEGERFCSSCGHRREVPMNNTLDDSWKALRSMMSRQAHSLADTIRSKVPVALERLATSSFCTRLASMFWALHPWVQLRHFSIVMGASIRALLLACKLFGALMMCSLFFDSTGSALTFGSPQECARTSFWSHFWRNVFFGLVSTIFSLVPLLVIANISQRRFIYKESWDRESKRSYVQCWRTQDFLLVTMAATYCGACIVYVMAFLANIDPAYEGQWLTSAVSVLLREFIFIPLMLAALYAAVATCVARTRPDLNELVHHKVEDFVGLTTVAEEDESIIELGRDPYPPDENDSWAERVGSGSICQEGFLRGPVGALEVLGEDDVPLPPLSDLNELEVEDASKGDPESPGAPPLPHTLDEEEEAEAPAKKTREAKPRVPPCNKCGSSLYAAFGMEICPMCGHLLPLKP